MVTLGFGFKSYIGFRMRQRKQRDVAKENEFYMQLLQQALPVESQSTTTQTEPPQITEKTKQIKQHTDKATNGVPNGVIANGTPAIASKPHRKSVEKSKEHSEKTIAHTNGSVVGVAVVEEVIVESDVSVKTQNNRRKERHREADREAKEAAEYLQRLENDAKRLRADLQSSRASEQELRAQVSPLNLLLLIVTLIWFVN